MTNELIVSSLAYSTPAGVSMQCKKSENSSLINCCFSKQFSELFSSEILISNKLKVKEQVNG